MYWFLMLVLIVYTFMSLKNKYKNDKILYWIVLILMTAMLAFRFGQGTDYFAYKYQYDSAPDYFNLSFIFSQEHGEFGYKTIINLFSIIGLPFEIFIFLISIFNMFMLHRIINKYSVNKALSLLLFLPTYYLTYFMGVRQGIVLATFLGLMLPLLLDQKYFKYCFTSVIMLTLHSSSIILLFLPVFIRLKISTLIKLLPISLLIGTGLLLSPIRELLIGFTGHYYTIDFSWGILEKAIMFALVMFLYYQYKRNDYTSSLLIKIYIIGFLLALAFFSQQLLSGRLTIYFKAIEIVLIPMLLFNKNTVTEKFKKNFKTHIQRKKTIGTDVYVTALILITIMIFTKNINAYISQGEYIETTLLNYPYISIFDKEEAFQNRSVEFNFIE